MSPLRRAARSLRAVLLVGVALAAPLAGQVPAGEEEEPGSEPSLILVDPETRVESVGFRFLTGSALEEGDLRAGIATRGLGGLGRIQEIFDFLPLVSDPTRPPFSPLQLQMDVARLRRLYMDDGFRDVTADYDVALDTANNRVRVEFVIDQGLPLLVGGVETHWQAEPPASEARLSARDSIPGELRDGWAELARELEGARGNRLSESERSRLQVETAQWFLDRGYPWVLVRLEPTDTVERTVDLRVEASPGPRARVDSIVIEGHARLSEHVLLREIPIRIGDWYDESAISDGEEELYGLELVRRALGDVRGGQPRDSTVTLIFRVEESLPRLVWGRVGWASETGAGGEAHWSHRNFLGDARTFTASLTVESGWGALEEAWGRSVGVSATVLQPYVWHRHLSATAGPFFTWRDDFRDRSVLYGITTALLYQREPLEMVSLQYELSRQRVQDAFELLPVAEAAQRDEPAFSPAFLRSIFRLSGAYGRLDDRVDPRAGFLLEPGLEITAPPSDVEYFRASLDAFGAVPIRGPIGLFLRAGVGRLFPFGASDPDDPELGARALVGLRGALFTAGGTADVRGWGAGMLGPRVPEVVRSPEGVLSERYLPVGGLARLTASAELTLPFPLLGAPHRTFVFVDAGRVWSPGDRLEPADPELALEPWGYGVGGGVQLGTPVGPLRLGVGYKLNPSRVDLLAPEDVARALAAGRSLADLETDGSRRWHLHLAIGRSL